MKEAKEKDMVEHKKFVNFQIACFDGNLTMNLRSVVVFLARSWNAKR